TSFCPPILLRPSSPARQSRWKWNGKRKERIPLRRCRPVPWARRGDPRMSELEYPSYESSEVSAREVIQLLRRRRWTVLSTFLVFLLAAAVLTPMMTPIYRARATMLIEEASQASSSSPDDKNPDKIMLGPTEPLPLDT